MEAASARAVRLGTSPGGALNRLRSDHRLAERFAAGDEGAFGVLYERHRRRLLAICIGVLGSYDDAQDALQNALATATASLRERAPEDVRAWLAKVTRNAAIDFARARRATSPLVGDEPAQGAEPGLRAQEHADIEDLVASLQRLPEQQRLAVVMRELAGDSYADIAAALEVDETAVRGLIARARVSLRAELEASELACVTVREELAHQPDGRRRPAVIRRHLRACEGCRDFAAGVRSDARALRGLAPTAGGLGVLGVASLLRATRPVAVGGAVAKAALGAGAIQAVAVCAVCLTAVEGVREVVIEPAHRAPRKAQAAGGAHASTAAAATGAASAGFSGSRSSAAGPSSPAADDRRQAADHRRAAARERLRDRRGAGAFVPDDVLAEDLGGYFGRRGAFGDVPRDRRGFDGSGRNRGPGDDETGGYGGGRQGDGQRGGGGGGRPPRERRQESYGPPPGPDIPSAPAPADTVTPPAKPSAPVQDGGAVDDAATP